MVNEAVDGGNGHGLISEYLGPASKGAIAGDDQAAMLIAFCDEFEENRCFRLVFADVSEVVENQAVDTVEFGEEGRKGEITPGGLQTLDKVVGAQVEDAVSSFD